MKSLKKQVKEIIDEPFYGHPSRDDYDRINKLEKIVLLLAEEIDKNTTAIINNSNP